MKHKYYKKLLCLLLCMSCITVQSGTFEVRAKDNQDIKKETNIETDINQYTNNEILLKMSAACSEAAKRNLFQKLELEVEEQQDQYAMVSTKSRKALDKAITYLGQSTYIEIMQPNYEYEGSGLVQEGNYTSDGMTFSKNQWALKNDGSLKFTDRYEGENIQASKDEDVNVLPFWKVANSKKSKQVIVALIDSGIDLNHPALKGKLWKNTKERAGDGIDNDKNGYVDDYNGWNAYEISTDLKDELGHGTHCAGVIAANGTDHVWGITGKSNVKVMPVKVFENARNGNTEDCMANSFSILRGIKYAKCNGAAICNLSIGMMSEDRILKDYMQSSSMLFVCAAGNEGRRMEKGPVYPAMYNFKNVIAVADLRCDGKLHLTSNYSSSSVDVAAPGTEIFSILPDKKYGFCTGTSMATPFVSGAAALLYSYTGKMNAATAKRHIVKGADLTTALKGKVAGGRLNVIKAYKTDVTPPYIGYTSKVYKEKGYARVELKVSDYGIAGVKYVRWIKGSSTKDSFKKGAKGHKISTTGTFTVRTSGVYTLYSIDKYGNDVVKKVTVKIPVPASVKLKKSTVSLKRGKSYTISPSVSPGGVYVKYSFSSSNKKVATVNAKGKITARKKGKATITVKTQNGKKKTCIVTVK